MNSGLCRPRASRWCYRLWQGLDRLRSELWPGRIDVSAARDVLDAATWPLFMACGPGDQSHALCVLAAIRTQGNVSPALARAALLHDVGKAGTGLSLLYRTLIVILKARGRLEQWARDDLNSWRYPLYQQLRHAEIGAGRCDAAGCDSRTVALVRWHETPPHMVPDMALHADLRRLQAADDRC